MQPKPLVAIIPHSSTITKNENTMKTIYQAFSLSGILLTLSTISWATPTDTDFTCPPTQTPGGATSYLSVISTNAPIPCMPTGWWYIVGLLNDQSDQQHSLQVNLFRHNLSQNYNSAVGAGAIGFSFNHNNQPMYLLSTYGDNMLTAVGNSIGAFHAPTVTPKQFSIEVKPFSFMPSDINYQFSYVPSTNAPLLGQLNANYQLNAKGIGNIFYKDAAKNTLASQTVQYNLTTSLTDKRGLVPEGYNGYVGINPNNASWELAAPNLQVNNWTLTITPLSKTGRLQETLTFTNADNQASTDRLWYDRQVINPSTSAKHPYAIAMKAIENYQQNNPASVTTSTNSTSQLYRGTWMSFCLNKTKLKGTCGTAVAFWQNGIATKNMNSKKNATQGFMNIYTPVDQTKGSSEIGNTLSVILPKPISNNPAYIIQNDKHSTFSSIISKGLNTYARIVYVTINPDSSIGAVLKQKAPSLFNSQLILKFETISPLTEDVMFTTSNAFFEGAANIYRCQRIGQCHNNPIGTGFVEQMGYSQ